MAPVCTIMVGRLDDWLEVAAAERGALLTPGNVNWAGIACVKRAYAIYRERGYRTRVLAAAYRNHRHWSELVGGDIVLTIPAKWQRLFNASDIEVDSAVRRSACRPTGDRGARARLVPDFRSRIRAGRDDRRGVRRLRRDRADTAVVRQRATRNSLPRCAT